MSTAEPIPVILATMATWPEQKADLPRAAAAFVDANGFEPKPGGHIVCPGPSGGIGLVVFGVDPFDKRVRDAFLPGKLATLLPPGLYAFAGRAGPSPEAMALAALGFELSAYRFQAYKTKDGPPQPRLAMPEGVDGEAIRRQAAAIFAARDIINTPANDMGPVALQAAAHSIARAHGARFRSIVGDDLLAQNFPLIHAVGRAAHEAPRLVDFTWGREDAPKVTLVGKGVTFDTGGLDIKPSSAMLLMKKDMAGAATALALAQMVMAAKLDVRLRVLLPIVENAVASDSFRPGDVYPSRKGFRVEIGNTDAEGRLVLCDALTLACEEKPDLLFDFATLTGAARVALGPDLPPFYCTDDGLAADIARWGTAEQDPVWRLPLWQAYESMLDSKVADFNNVSSGPFAGSITAALYLKKFIPDDQAWAHFDIYGWTPSTRPGRPEGGEPQTARLLHALLAERFGPRA